MNILVLGSCRVDRPSAVLDIPNCRIGGRYSTGDHVQAIEILRREKYVPHHLRPNVFYGDFQRDRYETLANLRGVKIDRAIIEICRNRTYTKDGWVVMNHAGVGDAKAPVLSGVVETVETKEMMWENLHYIKSKLGTDCQILLIGPSSFTGFISYYQICYVCNEWATSHGQSFFDPSLLAVKYGRETCYEKGGEDYYHFTDFMIKKMANIFEEWVNNPKTNINNTWREKLP